MRWLSLFSGCGGLDLGLFRTGHRIVACAETYAPAAEVYSRHFPRVPNLGDARTVDPSQLPARIDGICGGFPCQPFSLAGLRLGTKDSRGTLAFVLLELARKIRPRFILLENVLGLLSSAGGRDFASLLAALDACGYNAEWQVLDGLNWLPQHRERVFIVGRPRGTSPGEVLPARTGPQVPAGARRAPRGQGPRVRGDYAGTLDANYSKGGGRTVVKSPYGPFRVRSGRGAYADTLKTPTGGGTATSLYAVELLEKRGGTTTLRDGHTPSIRSKACNVGLLEDGRAVRRLTPLECERLQGFPDNWSRGHSDNARYRMVGDAVMVPVAEFLGRRISEADRA